MSSRISPHLATTFGSTALAALCLVLLCLCPSILSALTSPPKRILVLHSYYPDYPWTVNIMEGMEKIFNAAEEELRIHVEYLDTKRYHDPYYLNQLLDQVLRHKLKGIPFDLVLLSDDSALDFALKRREDLFASVPIIFCGANNFKPEKLAGVAQITGVGEYAAVSETLQLIRRLHPDTREIVVIGNTRNITDQLLKERFLSYLPRFENRLTFTFWDNLDMEELTRRLSQLGPGQIALFNSVVTYEAGGVLMLSESAPRLRKASAAPLYGLWDFALGRGIVGGMLVSSKRQGELAARMALQVLRGEKIENIPFAVKGTNDYMFDYRELKAFNIPIGALPAGSTVINRPQNFYQVNKALLRVIVGALFILIIGVIVLLSNIALRRKAERALQLTQFSVDHAAEEIFIVNEKGRFQYANDAACRILGYSRPELLTLSIPDINPGLTAEDWPRFWEICKKRKNLHFESRHRSKSGREFPVDITINHFEHEGKSFNFAHVFDITDRKAADEKLHQLLAEAENSRKKMDAILKSVADALIVTDTDNRVVLLNRTSEVLLGVRLGQALQKSVAKVIENGPLQEHLAAPLDEKSGHNSINLEVFDHGRGEVRFIHAMTSPVKSAEGEVTGRITLLRDLTREREIDRMKSEFISTAAHELRTPLTSVHGFAELLLTRPDIPAESQREYLAIIAEKAEHLGRIVSDLLDLSRIESGRGISLDLGPCSINELIGGWTTQLQKEVQDRRFEFNIPAEELVLNVDRGKLIQVFENLFSNAIKFSAAGSRIRLTAQNQGPNYRVCVEDEGVGMTAEQAAKIFDKFYRADASNTALGGLGLGMSIVKNIIKAHGGQIKVKSEPRKGTAVTFTLPLPSKPQSLEKEK